jgi:tetratricopeptide (TPR) repeat protein
MVLTNMGEDEPEIRANVKQAEEAQGFLLAGLLDRAAEVWPTSKKTALFKDRAKRGREYYLALAEKYKDTPEKIFEIGSLVGNLGYPEDARKLYEKAVAAAPEQSKYRINLALTLIDLGEVDKASAMLQKIVKDEPDNALAHYNLGVALNRTGQGGLAIDHLKKALDILPSLVGAQLALAEAYLEMGRLDTAEATLLEVTEKNAFVAEAWDMLGLIAGKRKDWEQAKTFHIRALSLEPYRATSHYNLGIALEEAGRPKEAAGAYQAAIRITPDDAEAHNNLGLVYMRAGLFEPAVKSFLNALDLTPQYPEAAYNLGLAYRAMDKLLPATEAFGLALELDPDLAEAKQQLDELNVQVKIQQVDAGVDEAPEATAAAQSDACSAGVTRFRGF